MAGISRFKHLKRLAAGPDIGDGAMVFLSRMKTLEQLDLGASRVGDSGLASLAALPALTTLFLSPRVTNAGMASIAQMHALRRLDASASHLTDAAMEPLSQLPNLQELALSQTHVTNAAIPFLARLSHLQALELSGTAITPDGLEPLRTLRQLRVISLSWAGEPTETDLAPLGTLPALRLVIVNGVALDPHVLKRLEDRAHTPEHPLAAVSAPALRPAAAMLTARLHELPSFLPSAAAASAAPPVYYVPPVAPPSHPPLPVDAAAPSLKEAPIAVNAPLKHSSSAREDDAPAAAPRIAPEPSVELAPGTPDTAVLRARKRTVSSVSGMRRIYLVQAELDDAIADASDPLQESQPNSHSR